MAFRILPLIASIKALRVAAPWRPDEDGVRRSMTLKDAKDTIDALRNVGFYVVHFDTREEAEWHMDSQKPGVHDRIAKIRPMR